MTTLSLNGVSQDPISVQGVQSVQFHHVGEKVLSASMADEIYGVFISQVILAPGNFIRWSQLNIDANSMDNIWVYIRNSDQNIASADWVGPFKNASEELIGFNKKLMQFMIVLRDNGSEGTVISNIELQFVSSQSASLFFSKSFNIGFRAEHILLTYNAEMSSDAVLRFAIAGEETTDISKYQYIDPNRVQELQYLPLYSDKIKLMMELAGDSGIPIQVHEIALVVSGDKHTRVNTLEESSPIYETSWLVDENGYVLISENDEIIEF